MTECWVQFNTHFQNSFIFANSEAFNSVSETDQQIIRDAVKTHGLASLDLARGDDQKYMDLIAEAGINVIVPNAKQLANIAKVVRDQVWPVMDEVIGKDLMDIMREKAGLK